jgi:hypothetical protein
MIAVHWVSLDRKYYAPLLSGATVFFLLAHAATIIFAFLIAYYTHGLWVKEASYREQPKVAYTHTCAVKLQGRRVATNAPFELVYNTLPRMNDMAEEHVRVPTIRVSEQHKNMDKLSDTIHLELQFPVDQDEGITHVQGIFMFQYELRNRVRLSMETPIIINYAAGVPGSGLLVDGHMRLKQQNPLPVQSAVRGSDFEAILARVGRPSAPDLTFPSFIFKAMERNESTVLDPALSSWTIAGGGCKPLCSFSLSLTLRVPNEKVSAPTPLPTLRCLPPKFNWKYRTKPAMVRRLYVPMLVEEFKFKVN